MRSLCRRSLSWSSQWLCLKEDKWNIQSWNWNFSCKGTFHIEICLLFHDNFIIFPTPHLHTHSTQFKGWMGGAKVSCILRHRGVQLILAYSWARPAVLKAGMVEVCVCVWGGGLLFLLFRPVHSCPSFFPVPLFHLLYYLFYLPFFERRHKMTHKGWRVVKPQHNQPRNLIAGRKTFTLQ